MCVAHGLDLSRRSNGERIQNLQIRDLLYLIKKIKTHGGSSGRRLRPSHCFKIFNLN